MSSVEQRMRATAAELTAAGLNTRVLKTHGVLDITATLSHDGGKDTQVIVDEDGYVQVSYWNPAPERSATGTVSGESPTPNKRSRSQRRRGTRCQHFVRARRRRRGTGCGQ
jgi:hypothetical protein